MTLTEFRVDAINRLNYLGNMASREVDWMIQSVLACDKIYIIINGDKKIDKKHKIQLDKMLSRRISGEPLQYILGTEHFMGLEFKVNPSVLIPRFDTEILINTVMNIIKNKLNNSVTFDNGIRILDIGTGSGIIPIVLSKLFQSEIKKNDGIEFIAVDISEDALNIAIENAKFHHVENSIRFVKSDLFSIFKNNIKYPESIQFDIIVSNPPYIPTNDIDDLQVELSFEPILALDGGLDGYDFYRRILEEAPKFLRKQHSSYLVVETGHNQADVIAHMMENDFNEVSIYNDVQSIPRVVCGKL